jgi:hypothetical protein
MAAAFELPHLTARDVVELAAAGSLTHPTGALLAPFTATETTVRSQAARARKRQQRAAAKTRIAELPMRDAGERLLHELGDLIEWEMDRIQIERQQGRPVIDEKFRQLVRAIREFTWLAMELDDPRPRPPGAKRNGIRHGGKTRGGLAGPLLRASEEADQAARTPVAVDHSSNGN